MSYVVFFPFPVTQLSTTLYNVFYYFQDIRRQGWTKNASELLRNIYDCDYSSDITMAYLEHCKKPETENQGLLKRNKRFWDVCSISQSSNDACFKPEFISRSCHSFPIKLVILALNSIEPC